MSYEDALRDLKQVAAEDPNAVKTAAVFFMEKCTGIDHFESKPLVQKCLRSERSEAFKKVVKSLECKSRCATLLGVLLRDILVIKCRWQRIIIDGANNCLEHKYYTKDRNSICPSKLKSLLQNENGFRLG